MNSRTIYAQPTIALLTVFLLAAAAALAHGDAEHVRGTVTNVSATSITVQTTAKQPRTITMNAKTMVLRGEAHANVNDIKVGDRVVIDVDKKTSLATQVKIGAAAAPGGKTLN
jgi:hypothetical protein